MNKISPLLKFTECFGMDSLFLNIENSQESYYIEKGINVEAFKKIMYKYDMEEYTIILLCYFSVIYFSKSNEGFENIYFEIDTDWEADRQLELDLTKALLFLYSDKSIDNTSITINKSRSSITIQNNTIVKHLANEIFLKYRSKGYNRINRTYEEAKKLMLADENWSKKVYHEVNIGTEINPIIVQQENEEEISMFAAMFTKEVVLNKDNLKARLKYLTSKYGKKRGAKVKNTGLACLCENLSFLKRIDRYINQSEIEHICNIQLTNEDCRFIYSCLIFFNIIEDNSKFRSKTLPENYIRSVLKQKKMDAWIEEDIYNAKIIGILELKNNPPDKFINASTLTSPF